MLLYWLAHSIERAPHFLEKEINFNFCSCFRFLSVVSFNISTNLQHFWSYRIIYLGDIKKVPMYSVHERAAGRLGTVSLLRNRQQESKNLATWGEKEQLAKIFNHFRVSSKNSEQENILVWSEELELELKVTIISLQTRMSMRLGLHLILCRESSTSKLFTQIILIGAYYTC